MHTFTHEEARRIALNCAKQYNLNLNGKSYLIIYKDKNTSTLESIEVQFTEGNYQHLTGIELIDQNGDTRKNVASLFFKKCLQNTLRKDEIHLKSDGTTQLKLAALPSLINIQKVTKIARDFNDSKPYLIADKVIGNVNFCLGLKMIHSGIYVPLSALMEDIRKLSKNQSQVIAIFSKSSSTQLFLTVRYVTKGVNLFNLEIPEDIAGKITLINYIPI